MTSAVPEGHSWLWGRCRVPSGTWRSPSQCDMLGGVVGEEWQCFLHTHTHIYIYIYDILIAREREGGSDRGREGGRERARERLVAISAASELEHRSLPEVLCLQAECT